MKAAARELVRMREAFLESLEPQVVELAILIAERVLQREVAGDREAIRRTARRALEHVVDAAGVTVCVNPADLEALRAEKVRLLETFEGIRQLTIRADARVSPGGCTVDTESVHIDAGVESQFARIVDALREPSETPRVE
ncbi:MAG: FliH/SctL family protein [Candidatus Hydrogenedentes bacterium]|nr:FliH/SctL family protein [Candidatus Hydrogenedentota bacterium]